MLPALVPAQTRAGQLTMILSVSSAPSALPPALQLATFKTQFSRQWVFSPPNKWLLGLRMPTPPFLRRQHRCHLSTPQLDA